MEHFLEKIFLYFVKSNIASLIIYQLYLLNHFQNNPYLDLPIFTYFKYYIRSKMKERHPFHIIATVQYEITDQHDQPLLTETSTCKFEVLKANLPININKILQRTGHVQISAEHLKKSEKKDRVQTRTDYMMYLYVTSILKRESLLVSHLSFKSGRETRIKSEIQWRDKSGEDLELTFFDDKQESGIVHYLFVFLLGVLLVLGEVFL